MEPQPLTRLRLLLADPPAPHPISSAAALRSYLATSPSGGDTVERAALAGFLANGVGWAFAGGYQAALSRLDPAGGRSGSLAALCATEEGGGHPRAIRTSLTPRPGGGWTLEGRKRFVTLGADAERLLVVASTGQDAGGRNVLRVCRLSANRPGVALEPAGLLPFTPEIGHAAVTFSGVAIADDELLAGDGYDDALKPFRTIEDIHVMAALLGWGIGVGRKSGWPREWTEDAFAVVLLLRALNAEPALRPETHLALAGAIASARRLLDGGAWAQVEDSVRERWERDRPLLDIASSVRKARTEAAWRMVEGAGRDAL